MPNDTRPWLTMVHGFSQNAKIFTNQEEYFRPRYRVFVPELKGHGENFNDEGPFGIREYTQDILAQLEAKKISPSHFWGTHTGAAVGLMLALQRPQLISSLVLEAPVIPGVTMPAVAAQMETTKSVAKVSDIKAAMEHWFDTAPWFEIIRQNPERHRADEHRRIVLEFRGAPFLSTCPPAPQNSIADELRNIRQRCLIYSGERDVPDFISCASLLERKLPSAQRKIFKALGGFPSWENPSEINPVVESFLLSQY